jgi:hypothetical protein
MSKKYFNNYKLPPLLASHFKKTFLKLSPSSIKKLVKTQMHTNQKDDDTFLKTYIIIGHDIPVPVKELTIYI